MPCGTFSTGNILRKKYEHLLELLGEWHRHGHCVVVEDDDGWRTCPICGGEEPQPQGNLEHEPDCLLLRTQQALEMELAHSH
jgi:hypothetical protein